jgi:hypothetical protein
MGSYTQGNDTYACSSSGCQISCASPEFGANVCYSMQQNFVDGTSCQGGGRCANGQCKGSSVGKEITSWIAQNKTLVIALACVLGGLLVLIVLSCCINSYRRRQRISKAKNNLPPAPPPYTRSQGWQSIPRGSQPQLPSQGQWDNGRWQPVSQPPMAWQPSVRYA